MVMENIVLLLLFHILVIIHHRGHYVAHILKDGRWVIFNDEHVALSEHPPKDLAYLYLYKRQNA